MGPKVKVLGTGQWLSSSFFSTRLLNETTCPTHMAEGKLDFFTPSLFFRGPRGTSVSVTSRSAPDPDPGRPCGPCGPAVVVLGRGPLPEVENRSRRRRGVGPCRAAAPAPAQRPKGSGVRVLGLVSLPKFPGPWGNLRTPKAEGERPTGTRLAALKCDVCTADQSGRGTSVVTLNSPEGLEIHKDPLESGLF